MYLGENLLGTINAKNTCFKTIKIKNLNIERTSGAIG